MESFNYSFAAIRGIQAGREYYVAMCPLKVIPRIFLYDEEEIPAELRAQRTLNRARIPEIARYLVENPDSYVFSAITASIDEDIEFRPREASGVWSKIGELVVPMTARFLINDGQHRRAAIEEALKERPELGDETIAVVFFLDAGLALSQQIFADLNKHAVRPTKSLGILYDQRDPLACLARNLIEAVPTFKNLTETEKTSISNRSTKLFTLNSIYQGTGALLHKTRNSSITPADQDLAIQFWTQVGKLIPEWQQAGKRKVTCADLRQHFVHAHGVILHGIGIAGGQLVQEHPSDWKECLLVLRDISWARSNSALWEGRAMSGGQMSKSRNNLVLTANLLKKQLGLKLSEEEAKIEAAFCQSRVA